MIFIYLSDFFFRPLRTELGVGNSATESLESAESADLPETVSSAAAQSHPTTRAGGQDDVSSKQTPSK